MFTGGCPITVKSFTTKIKTTTKMMVIHGAGESGTSSVIRQEEDLNCGQFQGSGCHQSYEYNS